MEDTEVNGILKHLKKKHLRKAAIVFPLALLLVGGSGVALAYTAVFTSPTDPNYSHTVTYTTLAGLISKLNSNPPAGNLAGFTGSTSELNVYSNAGGTALTIRAAQNSSDLVLSIPALSFTKTFQGATRSASQAEMTTWAETDPDGIVTQMEEIAIIAAGEFSGPGSEAGCFISTVR